MSQAAALSNHAALRRALLCLLYFCQGVPWGFATIALLAILSEAGHPRAETATVVALAILPWTFKFFWAPVIDSWRWPALGLRRPWIIVAQLGMTLTLFGIWSSDELGGSATLQLIAWVFFVHNCFASLQDVATDALAVDLLEDDERGRVNGLMWGAKLFGVALGGAGMATVTAALGLNAAVLAQALLLLAVLGLVVAVRERPGEKRLPWSAGAAAGSAGDQRAGLIVTLRALFRALSLPATGLLTLVALTAGTAEGFYDPLTAEFFVQHLGWSAAEYAQAQGTLGLAAELAGALLGGYIGDRFGQRGIALLGLMLISLVLLGFGLTLAASDDPALPHVLLLPGFRGCLAFATVSLFALFMKVSWTTAAATQFTLYMALLNLGYAAGARLNGWLAALGAEPSLADAYLVAGCLPLLPLALLWWVRADAVHGGRRLASGAAP